MSGLRLDQALAEMFPEHSRSRLATWVKNGDVLVDGQACKPRTAVATDALVEIDVELPAEAREEPAEIEFDVCHEDAQLIVVNKPVGLVVHPGAGNRDGTLVNGLLYRYPELAALPRAGLVHRIDKDTSGLLLVARTLEAHTALVRSMADREIKRSYRAVCHGVLTGGGTVDAPIDRHPRDRLRMAVRDNGREAITHYRVVERLQAATIVDVSLETGRTHQIRVHFAHLRHPLIGDSLYGGRRRIPAGGNEALNAVVTGFPRQALHAQSLSFTHPSNGELVNLSAPLAGDMVKLEVQLRELEH